MSNEKINLFNGVTLDLMIYDGLGERDQALAWLEKDFQQHSLQLPTITWRLNFKELRSDPRYADLARRMGLEPET